MDKGPILVTGGTGFIGRNLIPHLLADRQNIVLPVRKADRCPAEWLSNKSVRVVETGPLETSSNLEHALSGVSAVIHLAGLAHVTKGHAPEDSLIQANAVATERLVRAASDAKVTNFVNVSSLAAISGNASDVIVGDTEIPDYDPTPFGRSKRQAEMHVDGLADGRVFAVSLRLPLVVGREARGNWELLQRLCATGMPLPFASVHNRRSVVCIDSVVSALLNLATCSWPATKSGQYCFAETEPVSLALIVSALRRGMMLPKRLFSVPPMLLKGALELAGRPNIAGALLGNLEVDSSRFRKTFNFTQNRLLEDAIAESGARYAELVALSR